MTRSVPIISFVFICIFSFLIVSVFICPVYAGEQNISNTKKTDQAQSHDARDESVKNNQQQEFITNKGLQHATTNKDSKLQGAGFIKLKPKLEDDSVTSPRKVFNVEFMDDEMSKRNTKKDSENSTYFKFEKIEDTEGNNSLIRKEAMKDYKTELSMGYRITPDSEIYLGKGFLVERKERLAIDPRDNGWRIKFKLHF
jgi:hypothetical protein